MTDNNAQLINRRHEQRISLHGLDLKIRKSKLGLSASLQHYENCQFVDLSVNGFAFSNDSLEFKVPEKIDFILMIEEHEIKGTGVICNKRITESGTQYGLMFLSVTPEINTIFQQDDLSTSELKRLSENLAEQFVFSMLESSSPSEKQVLNKQQQLFDACQCYLMRLGEMGVRMPDLHPGKLLHPVQAVKIFRDPEQKLLLRWHNSKTGQSEEMRVSVEQEALATWFLVDNKQKCKTVLLVMEALGQQLKDHLLFI